MANAATRLFMAGFLVSLPAAARDGKQEQAARVKAPDVLVYFDGAGLASSAVLFGAKKTAARMFDAIGVRVQWANGRPGSGPDPAVAACAQRPEKIVVQLASGAPPRGRGSAYANAHPYQHDGVRITIFYDEVRVQTRPVPRLESVVLAHVLVHEITHVLQGISRHSPAGLMRARWTTKDFVAMSEKSLEFAQLDVDLIHDGLRDGRPSGCMATATSSSVRQ